MELRKRRGMKTKKGRATKYINLKSFDMKVLQHQPNKTIDFTAEYYQNQDLPDKHNIDRMLKNINHKIKAGAYNQ